MTQFVLEKIVIGKLISNKMVIDVRAIVKTILDKHYLIKQSGL